MNIFLVGFMGSGKSKLGKKLARKLDRAFVDLDDKIEEGEGMSISDIFKTKGEAYFRKIEQNSLFKLGGHTSSVVSLGGGACCNDLSWNFLDQNGLIIYIKEDADTLYGRLKANKGQRPLVADLDDNALRAFIKDKLAERSKYYNRAHFVFEKDKTSVDFLVGHIHSYLEQE